MLQTLCEPDRAVSMLHAPVSEQVFPLRVRDVMSVSPVTIPPSLSVHEAHTLMQQRKVRHLPVLKDGGLVGIILLSAATRAQAHRVFERHGFSSASKCEFIKYRQQCRHP